MTTFKKAETKTDFQQIAELADVIWRDYYIPIVGKPQIDYMLNEFQSEKAIKKQVAEDFHYYIIKYQDQEVGYLAVKPERESLFLSKIYVHSYYRGKGIGKSAMNYVVQLAKDYKLGYIYLTVNKNNTNAIKAYEKMGFENLGSLVMDIGNGFVMDDYKMKLYLDNN